MVSANFENPFWGLKENWWKQVYDGKYQHLGKDVFDKGLHGKIVEPGFFGSAKKACELASQHLGKKVDVPFYQSLNKEACSHFSNVSRSAVNVDADRVGKFRNIHCRFIYPFSDKIKSRVDPAKYDDNTLDKTQNDIQSIRKIIFDYLDECEKEEGENNLYICKDTENVFLSRVLKESYEKGYVTTADIDFMKSEGKIDLSHKKIEGEMEAISNELKAISERLKIPRPFAFIKYYNPNIGVYYEYQNEEEIHAIVEALFDEYYLAIEQADFSDEKKELSLRAIASLFQKLEWLHPFHDGQGRTDLILLSKLLVEQGFNPAIFYEPYFSSTATFDDWLDYLKQGILNWQIERGKLQPS